MAEFQWKAGADQTFDNTYGDVTLLGKSASFDKDPGKLFTLNSDNSLTLSEGANSNEDNEQTWDGEFHLVKGTFNVGAKGQPIGSLIMYGEKSYSRPEYTIFRSRANFNAYAKTQILVAGPDIEHNGNNPVISLFANSKTSLVSPQNGRYGGVFFNKTTLNLEGNATLSIDAGLFELENSTLGIINDATAVIEFASIEIRRVGSVGSFNLGGFIGENGNNVSDKASVAFGNGFDFMTYQYPRGFFNFNTRDVNGKAIINKGKFVFLGAFNAFQVKALLQQGALSIDGLPATEQDKFSFLYNDPTTQEPMLIISLSGR